MGAARNSRKILAALALLGLIPVLFILMLLSLIFGGLSNSGDPGQFILNNNTVIAQNVSEISSAINEIMGEGIADAEARIDQDFSLTDGDNYEIVNPYTSNITSMSIVVSSLTDDIADPVEMSKWAYEHGYWCSKSGSYRTLIPGAAKAWGLPVEGCTASEPQRILDALSSGKLAVTIMTKGHFTRSGHFIVLRGVQDGKILVADPASYKRSEKPWDLSLILNEASPFPGAGGPFWIIG